MRLALFVAAWMLVLCPVAGRADENGAGSQRRTGWYWGAGAGANWAPDMDQRGSNRDRLCYPTDACFDQDPVPEVPGYRWRYDIDADPGAAFELAVGRFFGRARLEVSFAQRRNDLGQAFRSIAYSDGTPREPRTGATVVSPSETSLGDLATRTLSLNAYYDFPHAFGGVTPYLGVGLGLASVEVTGLKFSSSYADTSDSPPAYDPPLSFYGGSQDEDLSDRVFVAHLHAGADYPLNRDTLLGLKLTYSILGDIEDRGRYSVHPFHRWDPEFTNRTRFEELRSWTLTLAVKRRFGG